MRAGSRKHKIIITLVRTVATRKSRLQQAVRGGGSTKMAPSPHPMSNCHAADRYTDSSISAVKIELVKIEQITVLKQIIHKSAIAITMEEGVKSVHNRKNRPLYKESFVLED